MKSLLKNVNWSVSFLTCFLVGCQGETASIGGQSKSADRTDGTPVSITFEANTADDDDDDSLSLADREAKEFKIQVQCEGIPAVEIDTVPFNLPAGARKCVAKLKSLKLGDKRYIEPSAGSGMTHFRARDHGILVNEANPEDKLFVKVLKQLPDVVTKEAVVQYLFSNVSRFNTVVGTRADVGSDLVTVGNESPKLKVTGARLHAKGMNVRLVCTDNGGFVGDNVKDKDVYCGSKEDTISGYKFALIAKAEGALTQANLQKIISESGKSVPAIASVFVPDTKTLVLAFKDLPTANSYLFIAEKQGSYTYGFIKLLPGNITVQPLKPEPQGNPPNFYFFGFHVEQRPVWRENATARFWSRPSSAKFLVGARGLACRSAGLRVPTHSDFYNAWKSNIVDLTGGDQKNSMGDLKTTFWLAGGSVFDLRNGTALRPINGQERHSILCVADSIDD